MLELHFQHNGQTFFLSKAHIVFVSEKSNGQAVVGTDEVPGDEQSNRYNVLESAKWIVAQMRKS